MSSTDKSTRKCFGWDQEHNYLDVQPMGTLFPRSLCSTSSTTLSSLNRGGVQCPRRFLTPRCPFFPTLLGWAVYEGAAKLSGLHGQDCWRRYENTGDVVLLCPLRHWWWVSQSPCPRLEMTNVPVHRESKSWRWVIRCIRTEVRWSRGSNGRNVGIGHVQIPIYIAYWGADETTASFFKLLQENRSLVGPWRTQ